MGRRSRLGHSTREHDRAALVPLICEQLALGRTLTDICAELGISRDSVDAWRQDDDEINRRIARAREIGADAIAEQALKIADTPLEGVEIEESETAGKKTKRGDMLGHRKLQVETRLKLLAKWFPQKYGDRVALTDGDGGALTKAAPVINLTLRNERD